MVVNNVMHEKSMCKMFNFSKKIFCILAKSSQEPRAVDFG